MRVLFFLEVLIIKTCFWMVCKFKVWNHKLSLQKTSDLKMQNLNKNGVLMTCKFFLLDFFFPFFRYYLAFIYDSFFFPSDSQIQFFD